MTLSIHHRIRKLSLLFVVGLFVVGFGALGDWFGETYYEADGIAYFDDANAIRHGDWTTALNPYWSIGYPLVLAATRWMFPPGWAGEWTSIHVVNLLIFVATYASFLYFVRIAATYATKADGADECPPGSNVLFVVATFIFLVWQMRIVSRTTPDMMVSGLFFLLTAASLQFCLRPAARFAIWMGLAAGLGYVAKAIFLPLSLAVFLVVLLQILTRSSTDRFSAVTKLIWALPAMALPILPYVIALSMVLGRFTLGESGSLNYAWTVNKLAHWHWIGGPAPFGEPIHPVRLLCASPHVYEFGEPIHVTYPPFFNPFYWYEGYNHFFSLKNQLLAIKANLFDLVALFFNPPLAPVKAAVTVVCLIPLFVLFTNAKMFWQRLMALWPVYLPSLVGLGIYLLVCVEVRYVVGFLLILLITPLLVLFIPSPLVDKKIGRLIVIVVSLLCLAYLIKDEWPSLGRAIRHESYTSDEEWRIGLYLTAEGPPPGTKVAMVRVERGIQTTWAYVSGLHIVSQIGNQDFNQEQQQKDFQLFINRPDVQQTVFNLFRKSGAVLVLALDVPGAPQGDGWFQVPGTESWIHRLDESAP
jgi:hypothetical protein